MTPITALQSDRKGHLPISPNTTDNRKAETESEKDFRTRKPLKAKITPHLKKYSLQTAVVRKNPLMKDKTHDIKMRSKTKENGEDERHRDKKRSKISFIKLNDGVKKLHNLELDKTNANNIGTDDTGTFFKEEEEKDRSEFIFLGKGTTVINDLLYARTDFESPTKALVTYIRQKR